MKIKVNIEPEDKDFSVALDFDVPDKELAIAKGFMKVTSAVASAIAQVKADMSKEDESMPYTGQYGAGLMPESESEPSPEHEPEPPPESHSPLEEESQSEWMPPTEDYK